MVKKIISIAFFLVLFVNAVAAWDRQYDAGESIAYGLAVDSSENIYAVGYGEDLIDGASGYDWWLKKYVQFQYKALNEKTTSPAHKSYIRELKERGLWEEHLKGIERVC